MEHSTTCLGFFINLISITASALNFCWNMLHFFDSLWIVYLCKDIFVPVWFTARLVFHSSSIRKQFPPLTKKWLLQLINCIDLETFRVALARAVMGFSLVRVCGIFAPLLFSTCSHSHLSPFCLPPPAWHLSSGTDAAAPHKRRLERAQRH